MSMTRLEHLLTIAAEECTEIGQRVSKALRFTLGEVQPGQPLTNAERIMYEFRDLQAVMEMLEEEGALPSIWVRDAEGIDAKKSKVEAFLAHSAEVGTLSVPEGEFLGVPVAVLQGDGVIECPNCMREGMTGAGVCSICHGEKKILPETLKLLQDEILRPRVYSEEPEVPCFRKCEGCPKVAGCLDAGVPIPLKVQTGGRLKVGGAS